MEDHASPPGPLSLCRLGDQDQIARASAKAGERGCFTAVQDLKPKRLIEADSPAHVVSREGPSRLTTCAGLSASIRRLGFRSCTAVKQPRSPAFALARAI